MTMENMGERQLNDSSSAAASSLSAAAAAAAASSSTSGHESDLISTHDLSPTISRSTVAVVSVTNMLDSSDFRSLVSEPTYQTLNGRMSPGYNGSYATLTPLQPLPPISTVSDKFGHAPHPAASNITGNFTFMQNNGLGMDMGYRYDKPGSMVGMNHVNMGPTTLAASPMSMMAVSNGYGQQPQGLGAYPAAAIFSQNGLHSPKHEGKMISPNATYEGYTRILSAPPPSIPSHLNLPNPVMTATTMNGVHSSHAPSPHSHALLNSHSSSLSSGGDLQSSKHEVEEINTKELAQKISGELKRYSIPQAVFAQRILCRSQGTLSDLLRNPKPWSKLKSGRETFRRMWKWLQEPEFQRMSALRLAGSDGLKDPQLEAVTYHYGSQPRHDIDDEAEAEVVRRWPAGLVGCPSDVFAPAEAAITGTMIVNLPNQTCKRKDELTKSELPAPKKPRLVFTDIQRRTLLAIFKETKRPSKEMQATIAEQLGLKVSTVANFFMNARRRSFDKYQDDASLDDINGMALGSDSSSPLQN